MSDPNLTKTQAISNRRRLAVAGGLLAGGLVVVTIWSGTHQRQDHSEAAVVKSAPPRNRPPVITADPVESFQTVSEVVASGGSEIAREVALVWLDRQAREVRPLSPSQVSFLHTMLENRGSSAWDDNYRESLFNSTYNALRCGEYSEPLMCILQKQAASDPDKIIRLYALQHIGLERASGRLTGPLADDIKADIARYAASTTEDVSGIALRLLSEWNGADPTDNAQVDQLALSTAADSSRSVDIRVSAVHAAGPAILPLARRLAADVHQPVTLRKAAIARIGRDGAAEDLAFLEKLRGQGARIAQATDPAVRALESRLSGSLPPVIIPLQ